MESSPINHTAPDDPLNPKNLAENQQRSETDIRKASGASSSGSGGGSSNIPPDVRSLIAHDAIKNSKLSHLLLKRHLTITEEAHARLEMYTVRILTPYVNEIREANRNGFEITPTFRDVLSERLYKDIQAAFATCGHEELHIMLSTVLLGLFMEKLESVN